MLNLKTFILALNSRQEKKKHNNLSGSAIIALMQTLKSKLTTALCVRRKKGYSTQDLIISIYFEN